MDRIYRKYNNLCQGPSDINEHLPTLYKYATECESIIELGVRGCVSSYSFVWGLLNNNKPIKKYFLNDINECDINELLYLTKDLGINIDYKWINDLDLILTDNVDMTFIDTWHVYGQLKRELEKYSKVTNKYIVMHDTTVDGIYGETIRNNWDATSQSIQSGFSIDEINCGLEKAITEFLENNPNWHIKEVFTNNNGLTVLKKNN